MIDARANAIGYGISCGISCGIGYGIMLTCRACHFELHRHLCHVLTELPLRIAGADVTDLLASQFNPDEARCPTE